MSEVDLYPGFDKNCRGLNTPIEPGIKPVCDALNSIPGVHTLWSCEGHPEMPTRPYVTFIAPQETAFKLYNLLNTSGGLKYCWMLIANFRSDGTLQYTIESNDCRIIKRTHRWWSARQWDQRGMSFELERLGLLLGQLAAEPTP